MTTGKRVVISAHSVRAALAEWKAQREAAEREAGAERSRDDLERTYRRTPADYADDLAPYVFSLLEKHAESQ
jgi:hypothetical protein